MPNLSRGKFYIGSKQQPQGDMWTSYQDNELDQFLIVRNTPALCSPVSTGSPWAQPAADSKTVSETADRRPQGLKHLRSGKIMVRYSSTSLMLARRNACLLPAQLFPSGLTNKHSASQMFDRTRSQSNSVSWAGQKVTASSLWAVFKSRHFACLLPAAAEE